MQQRRLDHVVRVRARGVLRERPRDPGERERRRRAARRRSASPTSHSPSRQSRSQTIEVACAVGQACPTCRSSRRPSSPAGRPRTTPARRCRPGRRPPRSGRSSGCGRGSRRSSRRARRRAGRPRSGSCRRALPGRDALRADHARVADVDHVRVAHVEADAEAGEEDGRADQQPDGPDGRRREGRSRLPIQRQRRSSQTSPG